MTEKCESSFKNTLLNNQTFYQANYLKINVTRMMQKV